MAAARILLANPDRAALRPLADALRAKGYEVSTAADGLRALQTATLSSPDLVVFDCACRVVDVQSFAQILRSNPHTEQTPVLTTGSAEDARRLRGLGHEFVQKPFDLEEIVERIARALRRKDCARWLSHTGELRGDLRALGVGDLLLVLAACRGTGRLALRDSSAEGEILFDQGRPTQARFGRAEGDKALLRLLALREGTYAFEARPPGSADSGRAQAGALQADEPARSQAQALREALPREQRWQIASRAELLPEQHPAVGQVVSLLSEPRTLDELLDEARAEDLEVLCAVHSLLEKGVVEPAPIPPAPPSEPLLEPADCFRLRARLARGRAVPRTVSGKLVLMSESHRALTAFLEALAGLPEVTLLAQPTPELLGTWARIRLVGEVLLDLCSIPGADEARPLWRPLGATAAGAIAIESGPATIRLARALVREAPMPLIVLGEDTLPPVLRELPRVQALPVRPREAIRAVLEAVASAEEPDRRRPSGAGTGPRRARELGLR